MWNLKYTNKFVYKTDSMEHKFMGTKVKKLGGREGYIKNLGLADANYYIPNK